MRVLFVSSGNSEKWGISLNVLNQGEALKASGMIVDYYTIKGKGWKGYLRNIKPLHKYLKQNHYDIIHAHFSLTAFLASLAGARNLVVSLMGDDVNVKSFFTRLIPLFYYLFQWRILIVKSEKMKDKLNLKGVEVVPNGVNIDKFKILDRTECRKQLGWELDKKHLLFAAISTVKIKNYRLAQEAVDLLGEPNVVLHSLHETPNELMPLLYNAADVVLLTSLSEGSPNVVKEAMACARPLVCTDVGDVRWLFGELDGHYITSFSATDTLIQIRKAIAYEEQHSHTHGRERIMHLHLDTLSISARLRDLYERILITRN